MLVTIVVTILVFILLMFFVILFIVYFDYMLSVQEVGGRHYVSMVLIRCLPVDTPYILGHVVDHGCDTPVESFEVHSPNIGARRMRLRRKTSSILNLPY